MEGIPRIHAVPRVELLAKLAEKFDALQRRARLTGRVDVLLKLDRIPDMVLGPLNRVSEGAEEAAIAAAIAALSSQVDDLNGKTTK